MLFCGSPRYFGVKENALAFHAFRKICSAVKKAALFERRIAESLFDHYTIMNTTKATPDHHKCEFAAFRLSKFFVPSATGVWGIVPQEALGTLAFSKYLAARRNLAPPRLLAKASACLLKTTLTYQEFVSSSSSGGHWATMAFFCRVSASSS